MIMKQIYQWLFNKWKWMRANKFFRRVRVSLRFDCFRLWFCEFELFFVLSSVVDLLFRGFSCNSCGKLNYWCLSSSMIRLIKFWFHNLNVFIEFWGLRSHSLLYEENLFRNKIFSFTFSTFSHIKNSIYLNTQFTVDMIWI